MATTTKKMKKMKKLTKDQIAELVVRLDACSCTFAKLCKVCMEGLESMGFEAQRQQGEPVGRYRGPK